MIALEKDEQEIAVLLIEYGCDVTVGIQNKNCYQLSPVDVEILWKMIDINNRGEIDFEDFSQFALKVNVDSDDFDAVASLWKDIFKDVRTVNKDRFQYIVQRASCWSEKANVFIKQCKVHHNHMVASMNFKTSYIA